MMRLFLSSSLNYVVGKLSVPAEVEAVVVELAQQGGGVVGADAAQRAPRVVAAQVEFESKD